MARTPDTPVNPEILTWARKVNGLSLDAAAVSLGFESERLELWESGIEMPSFSQLKKIANVYKRAPAFFFLLEPPKEPKVPKDFRVIDEKGAIKLAPSTLIEIRKVQARREYAAELATLLMETPSDFTFATTLSEDTEALGLEWRRRLGINGQIQRKFRDEYDALNTWRRSIENVDVLVFQASLESIDELRGLAVYHQKFPLILLNTKDSTRGRIFSLLHEFCHLLLHTSGIGNMEPPANRTDQINKIEVFCNAFAAACLLPLGLLLKEPESLDIGGDPDSLSIEQVDVLVRKYQVSWEVVLRRYLTAGILTSAQYVSKRAELVKMYAARVKASKGFALHATKKFSYAGEKFTKLVLQGYEAGAITSSDVSIQLGVKINKFSEVERLLRRRLE